MLNSAACPACGRVDWASHLEFPAMTPAVSREIADNWKYPSPFDFYDATADPEDYQEFITPSLWPAIFRQVRHCGNLVGFLTAQEACGRSACEISLGMHPDLTGKGLGLSFLTACLAWLTERGCRSRFALSVAAFNTRAIKVYRAAGFSKVREFAQETNGGVYDFIEMERDNTSLLDEQRF